MDEVQPWSARVPQKSLHRFHALLGDQNGASNGSVHLHAYESMMRLVIQEELQSVKEELKSVKGSLMYEIQASKEECLSRFESAKVASEEVRNDFLKASLQRDQFNVKPQPKEVEAEEDKNQDAERDQVNVKPEPKKVKAEEDKNQDADYHKKAGEKSVLHSSASIFRIPGEETSDDVHPEVWELGELEKKETSHSWFSLAWERCSNPKSGLHSFFMNIGFGLCIPKKRPANPLVSFCDTTLFHCFSVLAILANIGFTAYVADRGVRKLLSVPPEVLPDWWEKVDTGFTVYFGAEVVLRMMAFRGWFFVAPTSAMWNWFDLFLCTVSAAASGLKLNVMRSLRIFRVMRMVRVIAESQYLTALRNLANSVIACLVPLFWATVFLAMTFFMFSMFIMQGISNRIGKHRDSDNWVLLESLRQRFEGFDKCFLTLLVIVCGEEWTFFHEPLSSMGAILRVILPLFVVFVNIGVMNIVIGVFADASASSKDRSAIAHSQIAAVEDFCMDMISMLQDMGAEINQPIKWEVFREYCYREETQAYFSHHGLDVSHVKLIFELIDRDGSGKVGMRELILGALRLKGQAKGLDSRVMLHALRRTLIDVEQLGKSVDQIRKNQEEMRAQYDAQE